MAEFYSAQIVLCLEYLHGQDIIYRDLKPDNILIAENGYIRMMDFGFSKKLYKWDRTYTFCGTPEYIAPEILLHKPYGHSVDWYSLGIIMYELLYGRTPFIAEDPMTVFRNITENKILFPKGFDPEARNIIKRLTTHDLSKRYGSVKGTMFKIKNHSFFKHMDWEELLKQEETPQFVPPKENCCNPDKIKNIYDYSQLPERQRYPPVP